MLDKWLSWFRSPNVFRVERLGKTYSVSDDAPLGSVLYDFSIRSTLRSKSLGDVRGSMRVVSLSLGVATRWVPLRSPRNGWLGSERVVSLSLDPDCFFYGGMSISRAGNGFSGHLGHMVLPRFALPLDDKSPCCLEFEFYSSQSRRPQMVRFFYTVCSTRGIVWEG